MSGPGVSETERRWIWILVLILVGAVSFVLPFALGQFYAGVLLAPTAVLCMALSASLHRRSDDLRIAATVLVVCELLKTICVALFCAGGLDIDKTSSMYALGVACAIALFVAVYSNTQIHRSESRRELVEARGLSRNMERMHQQFRSMGLVLYGFIGLFLYVTYFLTFALAFHDKAEEAAGRRALFAVPFEVDGTAPARGETRAEPRAGVPKLGPAGGVGPRSNSGGDRDENLRSRLERSCFESYSAGTLVLLFNKSSASFGACERAAARMAADLEIDDTKLEHTVDDLVELDSLRDVCSERSSLAEENLRSLVCFSAAVRQRVKVTPYCRLQVKLVGHATEEQPDSRRFPSNYELSQARILSAQELLSNVLRTAAQEAHIEWLQVPRSSEIVPFPVNGSSRQLNADQHQLSVEVSIDSLPDELREKHAEQLLARPARLELLDYLYFMIYTITTTGYGDMRPVTPLAKFICSVANFFEVLFLVILCNVLLSAGRAAVVAAVDRDSPEATS